MAAMGFRTYVPREHQSHIITSFLYPEEDFDFRDFYDRLHARGHIIYPGKLTEVGTFRIGSIGSIDADEIHGVMAAIDAVTR